MKTAIVICVVAAATVVYSQIGILSKFKYPDAEARSVALKIRAEVEKELRQEMSEFKVVGYKTHTTEFSAGRNYFLKVRSGQQHLHIRAHKAVGGHVSMTKVDVGHTSADELKFF